MPLQHSVRHHERHLASMTSDRHRHRYLLLQQLLMPEMPRRRDIGKTRRRRQLIFSPSPRFPHLEEPLRRSQAPVKWGWVAALLLQPIQLPLSSVRTAVTSHSDPPIEAACFIKRVPKVALRLRPPVMVRNSSQNILFHQTEHHPQERKLFAATNRQ